MTAAEISLCKLLIQSDSAVGPDTAITPAPSIPWDPVIQAARLHGLDAVLYQHIVQAGLRDEVPEKPFEQLHHAAQVNAAHNLVFLWEAGSIFKALQAAKIPVMVLKGLYLLEHVYRDVSLRSMSDLDILLRKADIPKALPILEALGYQPTTYFDSHDENIDIKHVPPLLKGDDLYLELHWALLEENEPFSIDTHGLWERAVPAHIAGIDVLALSLEDLVLHLCLHLAYQHHLQLGLRGLYDIALVLGQQLAEVNWEAVTQRAKAWRAERVAALTFRLLELYFDTPIPEVVYEHLLSKPIPDEIFDQAREKLLSRKRDTFAATPDLVQLATTRGLWSRIKLIASRIFLPRKVIARLYAANPRSPKIYRYYFVRFVELWRAYFQTAWRSLFNRRSVLAGTENMQAAVQLKHWLGGESMIG